MLEIISLLACLNPVLNYTSMRQLACISEAMLAISGRVTMLGLSRWTSEGGSYRTIQRFFSTKFNWPLIRWLFVRNNLLEDKNDVILITGDEVNVTKSGKKTYGIGRFFSSLYGKVVPSLYFLNLSLTSVKNHSSHPIVVEQITPDLMESKKDEAKSVNKKGKKAKPGRPSGSKNKNRKDVELSPYLKFVQNALKGLLTLVNTDITLAYFVFDGAFGNNDALQMVRQCSRLHMISKMRHDSALYLPYSGKYSGKGRKRIYGKKLDYDNLPNKYLKSTSFDNDICTCIYQMNVLHKLFADILNVVIIVKTNMKTGKTAHIILFSSDLELGYDKLIEYYQLRFQIEFNFRDAKQFWGLEDFMNIKPEQVYNAANLSMFMVILSQALLREKTGVFGQSINDLKAWFRASKYVQTILNLLGQNPDPILIENVTIQASQMGRVNPILDPVSQGEISL
jgi:putative transposase